MAGSTAPAAGIFRNASANALGYAWGALLQVACIPIYVRAVGIHGYGLVGFYMAMFAALQVFDLGLTTSLNRELARATADPERASDTGDLVRTVETGYLVVGAVLGATLALAAPLVAARWLTSTALPPAQIETSVRLMAAALVLQWPVALYHGALMGLERQVRSSAIRAVGSTLLFGGTACVVLVVPSVVAFFAWQVAATAMHVVLVRAALGRAVSSGPAGPRPRFRPELLRSLARLAASVWVITALSLVVMQADKLIVSSLLSLEELGRYTLAWTAANGLLVITMPVFNALFPRLSALLASDDGGGARRVYDVAAQLLGVGLGSVACVLMLFPDTVVRVWTGDPELAAATAPVVRVLVFGTALNGFLFMPYALQLAAGWTRPVLVSSIVSALTLVPAIVVTTRRYGAIGPAAVWLTLNVVSLFTVAPIVHRRLLSGAGWSWLRAWLTPAALAFGVAAGLHAITTLPQKRLLAAASLVGIWAACAFIAATATELGRERIARALSRRPA